MVSEFESFVSSILEERIGIDSIEGNLLYKQNYIRNLRERFDGTKEYEDFIKEKIRDYMRFTVENKEKIRDNAAALKAYNTFNTQFLTNF